MNSAADGPPMHRHDWAQEDPSVRRQTQNQPRAAGVDPSPRSHEYPKWQQNPSPWYRPGPTQSAPVPPVGGRLPQPQYWTPQAPLPYQYQPPRPEPLFVAVNPFEARRWRHGSPARPAQPQPESTVNAPLIPPSGLFQLPARDAAHPTVGSDLNVAGTDYHVSPPLGVRSAHVLEEGFEDEEIDENPLPRPPGACTRCKKLKMKCEFETEAVSCKRCLNGGHDCVVLGRQPRSRPRERYRPGEHPGDSHVPHPPTHPPRANSAAVEDATRYSPIYEASLADSLSIKDREYGSQRALVELP
ncbi:hypothetical protein DFH08DRAFT_952268 [Mycena albidolilacea]|uniref:Zn(2)-C6 fungal-type domain-containing protein n=1 Tax=Mycena albidolilacea TaxID=1033008 RepID=A0AAD7AHD6_9AGAR|nr:hypothetical protein DFH08DRAFT_952268 [Mycena albidolilacea]